MGNAGCWAAGCWDAATPAKAVSAAATATALRRAVRGNRLVIFAVLFELAVQKVPPPVASKYFGCRRRRGKHFVLAMNVSPADYCARLQSRKYRERIRQSVTIYERIRDWVTSS